jgi:hypothetical protein
VTRIIAAELVVYAATSAGVCAAVTAARAGVQTVLIEPGNHVGGMTSGGLGYTDIGDSRVLGGMAAELRDAIADHYGVAPGTYAGPEPHVAEAIYLRWLDQAGVDVVFGERVEHVRMNRERIQGLVTATGQEYTAGVFIDASYEGDVMAMAGVPFAVGREDRSLYGERFAGRQELVPGMHIMPPWISPFQGDPSGVSETALVGQVKPEPLAEVGSGDGGVMSYGYRLCLSTGDDRIPFTRRDGYDESHWELGRRLFRRWELDGNTPTAGRMIGLEQNLPGGKADGNSLGPFSLSVLDGSAWLYPTASHLEREQLRLRHLHHAQDFLWFLSHDPAVPWSIRTELEGWGLAADEFADTDHFPHQLYVREARRMLGQYILTEHDLLGARPHDDVIAMGSYHIDIREVQRAWRWVYEHPRPIGMVFTEGYLSVPVPPYGIPYRSMLPQPSDCSNLIVPVCISASHVAFASVRMEVQYQMLGHAAGLAAAHSLRAELDPHDIDRRILLDDLRAQGQVLAL